MSLQQKFVNIEYIRSRELGQGPFILTFYFIPAAQIVYTEYIRSRESGQVSFFLQMYVFVSTRPKIRIFFLEIMITPRGNDLEGTNGLYRVHQILRVRLGSFHSYLVLSACRTNGVHRVHQILRVRLGFFEYNLVLCASTNGLHRVYQIQRVRSRLTMFEVFFGNQ